MTTNEEKKVLCALLEVQESFVLLDPQHPGEREKFIDAVNVIEGLIMQRVARRVDPAMFKTFRNVRGVWEVTKIEG